MSTRSKRSSTATTSNRGRSLRKQKLIEDSIDSMCRVCMRWNSNPMMVDLFDRAVQDTKLSEVLSLVGAVQISQDDQLPKLCCTRCLKDLERAYKLRMVCQDSDRKLRDLFSDVEVAVVKEEFHTDEMNPLEVVCNPDVDRLLDDEKEAGPSENIVQPKLEIEADEDVADWNEMADDGAALEDKEPEEQPEEKIKRESKKFKYPDVFDEIPAVGFRCCGCKKIVHTFEELLTHSQVAHADKKQSTLQLLQKMQCDICYKVLSHPTTLEKHKSLGKVNFRCQSCGDLFWSRRRAYDHFKRIHGPNPTVSGPSRICCACLEKFETEQQLKEHSEAVHLPKKPPPDSSRPFICNICYRSYKSDTDLYAHQTRMIKRSKNHMCVECGKTFMHPSLLRDHEIYHSGEKVFQCPHCPASYSNKESYRKHIQSHVMPADKFKCKICGRCYRNPRGLQEHVRLHTGERPHQCTLCPANYARLSSFKIHLLTHSGERNFQCPLCEKRFGTVSACQNHVEFVHHKLKPFPCFFCPKRYPRKDYRKRHMVSAHPNELRDNPVPEIELFGSSQWQRKQSQ
ncbi:gastrula zinc finger protein XlCGF26.1-like [Ochlerotatus camptorhynchus]|uniref:gastrula zinc finger protein XlCGF26.1-like n=1 Tax=Ochlerotatus camptorhynchus TaxID=644619 RepID=UPI0031DB8940